MITPEKRLQDIQARGIIEQIIEYGLRQGLLDALRLAYERMKDGCLVVHFPRHRGLWRILPPGVGEASAIRVVALGDDGRMEMGAVTLLLGWDAAASSWIPSSGTEEISAEVWKVMALLAREAGWLQRTAA